MTRFINLLIIIIINHAYWRCELTQASVGHFNTTPKLATSPRVLWTRPRRDARCDINRRRCNDNSWSLPL